MEIRDRLKLVRQKKNLNQEAFGKRINLTKFAISSYENKRNNIPDRVISDVCREFNICENWLRYGTGEMEPELPEDALVAKAAQLLGRKEPLFEALLETYYELTPENRELLIQMGLDLLHNLSDKIEQQKKE